MITIKHLDNFIKFLLVLALIMIAINTASRACDEGMALDMESMKCEDVNLTLNPAWKAFY